MSVHHLRDTGHRRRLRHAVAAVALFGIGCLAPAPVGASSSPGPETGASATQEADGPTLTLVGRSPWVAANGAFDLDIATDGVTDAAVVQIVIREPVESIAELDRSDEEDVGRVIYRSPRVALGFIPLQPDGTRRLPVATSTTTSDAITARLRHPGVYPVIVTLEDDRGNVAVIRTPVVRLGTADDTLPAPRLDLVVDVAVPPTVEPDGRRSLSETELARLGRLAALLDGTAGPLVGSDLLSLTVAAQPDTLDALTASADPRATQLLDALTSAGVGGRTALGLPTVDVSAPALVDADLAEFVPELVADGRATLQDRLAVGVDSTIWDATGGIDARSARLLDRNGFSHVLIDASDQVGDSPAVQRSLVDVGPIDVPEIAPLDALVVDRATTDALLARSADRFDAGHLALADLLLRDESEAEVAIRIADAPTGSLLLRLLALVASPDSPVPVGPLRPRSAATGDEGSGNPGPVRLPDATADLTDITDLVHTTSAEVDTFAGLVTAESARADAYRLRIATSLATGVPDDARHALLQSVDAAVGQAFGAITLAGQTDLNLTSRSGTLPLMIRNTNPFPVRVVLSIRSDRLAFPEGDHFEYDLTEEITRVDIPVKALATGSVPTFVALSTPDQTRTLDSRQLNVRSTAISGVGLAISLGALAVLVFWWARTWRRNRRAKQTGPEGAGA